MTSEAKDGEMYCTVEGCGLVDESHTAHCIKHGRVTHKMKGQEGEYMWESKATLITKGQSNKSMPPAIPEKLPPNALVDIYAKQQLDTLDKQKKEKENATKE